MDFREKKMDCPRKEMISWESDNGQHSQFLRCLKWWELSRCWETHLHWLFSPSILWFWLLPLCIGLKPPPCQVEESMGEQMRILVGVSFIKLKALYSQSFSRRIPTFGLDHSWWVWWVFHVHRVPRFKQSSCHCRTLLWRVTPSLKDSQKTWYYMIIWYYMHSARPSLLGVVVGNYKMYEDDPDEVNSIST